VSGAERVTAGSRIVVSFDTTPAGEAALEAAIGLAAGLDAEVAGLFVEDVALMRMAALPFTRELGLTSALLRPIETADIERALRLQGQQTRALLAAAAAALNLRWSFQVVRGQSVTAVLECTEGCTLVVLGTASAGVVGRSVRPVGRGAGGRPESARERFRHLSARPIVVLFNGSERAMRSLAAAHMLAARAGTRLTLLVTAGTTEDFERLRQQTRSWLAERGAVARFVWLKSRDVESVVQAVGAENASALLWHEADAPAEPRALRRLLSELGCPLILVS
jgi:nucleotide-binding universal stress UspA family protein